MKPNNTFLGYEQHDKFLFVRPANIITIYQRGTEWILETDKKQHVVKDEEINPAKIISIELACYNIGHAQTQ